MVRIDLPELGEGQYVEIREPKYLKWKEEKELSKLANAADDMEAQLTAAEKLALMIIKGGYILDEDNKPFQFPLDENSIQELPGIVIETVAKKFAELKNAGADQKN